MFFVYILRSKKDKSYYVGLTEDIKSRVKEHNLGLSKYTRTRIPWKLIWFCAFANKNRAAEFEKYLKNGSGIAFMKKRLV